MISVHGLKKNFGAQPVLQGVDFSVEAGEAIVIIGRSGCGKSILLKHLIGLMSPDAGEVRLDGQRVDRLSEREFLEVRRRFGMLFQGAALFDSLTVGENVAFPLHRQRRWTPREIRKKVGEALEMVSLERIEDKMPSELSGGMRKRVGLARAIVYQPEVILYDEPTTGLDPVVAATIDQLMVRVWEQLKVTTLVVTHDMRSAGRVGQRILMLHEGRIQASGTPQAMFEASDPIVRHFVQGIPDDTPGDSLS